MKRLTLIFTVLVAFFAFSCEETAIEIDQEALVKQGEWKVLFFFDENGDKGISLKDYSFQFKEGGTVVATEKNINKNGTWLIGQVKDQGSRMVLSFDEAPLLDMKKEWIVKEIEEDKIELLLLDGSANSQNLVFTRVK